MFSFLKTKVPVNSYSFLKPKDPLQNKDSRGFIDTLAKHVAKLAISDLESLQQMMAKLNKSPIEDQYVSDVVFEYWILKLHLVSLALTKSRVQNKDDSDAIFATPVYDSIYSQSKLLIEMYMHGLDGSSKNVNGNLESIVTEKLKDLAKLPLATADIGNLQIEESSVIALTIKNIFQYSNITSDFFLDNVIFNNELKSAINFLEILDKTFVAIRIQIK